MPPCPLPARPATHHAPQGPPMKSRFALAARVGARFAALLAACLAALFCAPASAQVAYLEGHTEQVYTVAYSPDGALIVSGGFDKTARVWDRANRTLLRTITDPQQAVFAVAVSRDGAQLACGGYDNIVRGYDMPLP